MICKTASSWPRAPFRSYQPGMWFTNEFTWHGPWTDERKPSAIISRKRDMAGKMRVCLFGVGDVRSGTSPSIGADWDIWRSTRRSLSKSSALHSRGRKPHQATSGGLCEASQRLPQEGRHHQGSASEGRCQKSQLLPLFYVSRARLTV